MTEEIRPICLYIETCLHKKEGTKNCNKCEHHLNYWTEVMIRDMEKNISRLKQENEELKKEIQILKKDGYTRLREMTVLDAELDEVGFMNNTYRSALEEIREKAQHCIRQDVCALCDYSKECAVPDADGLVYDNNRLLIKLINEVLQ